MKRILSLVVTLVVMGALSGGTLWAADPWKSNKKYTDWSEKEVRKVLQKSPWAKTFMFFSPPGSGIPTEPGGLDPVGGSVTAAPEAETRAPVGGYSGGRRRPLQLLVRWHTALPVRQALARRQMQAEEITPEQAEQLFQQAPSEYVVMVGGLPMAAMGSPTKEKIKAGTYLKTGDKQRIMVKELRRSRGQAPDASMSEAQVPDLFFIFPRATPIELRHKSVEFVTKLGKVKIKKKFKLKDMLFGGKLEL